ncbi:MAG: rhodanese-like domain-containing protein [Eubacteriaceae bacterium]|nr:rhodanese-like domain-containing protein [Eubacteriaceae bacterium]
MNKIDYFKARQASEMSCRSYKQILDANDEKYAMLDARPGTPEELKQTIPGAIMIPINDLADNLDKLPKDKTIVVNCFSLTCTIAVRACILLLENGFDAMEMRGGMEGWLESGYPTTELVPSAG